MARAVREEALEVALVRPEAAAAAEEEEEEEEVPFGSTAVVIRGEVAREEDKVEGRDEVVDALHVARRGVSQRPNAEDTLERALHDGVAKELGAGQVRGTSMRIWCSMARWLSVRSASESQSRAGASRCTHAACARAGREWRGRVEVRGLGGEGSDRMRG